MQVTVCFDGDRDGRPCGSVASVDGGPPERFDGWLELLRALELIAYRDVLIDDAAEEAAS